MSRGHKKGHFRHLNLRISKKIYTFAEKTLILSQIILLHIELSI